MLRRRRLTPAAVDAARGVAVLRWLGVAAGDSEANKGGGSQECTTAATDPAATDSYSRAVGPLWWRASLTFH